MKKLIRILRDFAKEDFRPDTYGFTAVFLVVCIAINYYVDFEDVVIAAHDREPEGFFVYFFYYAFAYYTISVTQLLLQKRGQVLHQSSYWLRSAFFIALVAFSSSFYYHHLYENSDFSSYEHYYFRKIAAQLKSVFTTFLPLILFWFFNDRDEGFYGLRLKGVDLKPYWLMIAGMSVLVFLASFGSDFQDMYPVFKPWKLRGDVFGLTDPQLVGVFEASYGFSFFAVELLFRGALIIGMARLLGKDAILPMVSMYAFLHFGKPLGETIGSVFGGYILGVIALRTRHIFGGCIIHIGVAFMMELFAWWQHLR